MTGHRPLALRLRFRSAHHGSRELALGEFSLSLALISYILSAGIVKSPRATTLSRTSTSVGRVSPRGLNSKTSGQSPARETSHLVASSATTVRFRDTRR